MENASKENLQNKINLTTVPVEQVLVELKNEEV